MISPETQAHPGNLPKKYLGAIPRLPLEGNFDLTYRCNNKCRHCWLRIAPSAKERRDELSFAEIEKIVNEARKMGCRKWKISGGEPMLRPDFPEIFDFLTQKAVSYSLNTNGTLITPAIARLLTRKGLKMVALYGATAAVHNKVTRTPGSFEATMQGFAYLKEAGAAFTVQLIPMRDNYHQLENMVALARSLSPRYRIGASLLYFSASGSKRRNAEIGRQRLDPKEVLQLDQPDPSLEDWFAGQEEHGCRSNAWEDHLYARCIALRREFFIDPYGGMTFCDLIKDPALCYDLRTGSFREAWETFIPSLANRVRCSAEYRENCGRCDLRNDCWWCGGYGYLEHGRHGAKVEYLCQVARENRAFIEDRQRRYRRYYGIAGITVMVEADLPITDQTFAAKFRQFEVGGPGPELISIRHHFSMPDITGRDLGQEVHRQLAWTVYRKGNSWIYLWARGLNDPTPQRVAVFNHDYTRARIYSNNDEVFLRGNCHTLTLFPTDQVLLAWIMADHAACVLHSSGAILNGQGLLFVGHSQAGKSTMVKMLQGKAEILCDDRNIVRRWPEGFRVHGTWSHGDVPLVSAASAPLAAICFLRKSRQNRLIPLKSGKKAMGELLSCLIKPLVTADWWQKTLALVEAIVREVPCYVMESDNSGKIAGQLEDLVRARGAQEKALER
jgi:MoaA/NifB/PqqE/SkfB family radical SAM enzyme